VSRSSPSIRVLVPFLALLLAAAPAAPQEGGGVDADALSGLRARNIGPATMSGRIVDLAVVEAEVAVAGDTATGATKQVTTETGLKVQVPLFVKEGDVIRVDTRSGEYITRV